MRCSAHWTAGELPDGVKQAGALLAAVVGQDLDEGEDGVFRIARRVAKDRIISIVDPGRAAWSQDQRTGV